MSGVVDRKKMYQELSKVVDPEVGVPITEMNLVDKMDINPDGSVLVEFHLTAPFCPPMFALKIAQDIKENLSKVEGVKGVTVTMKDHYMAEYINKVVNAPKT